MSKRINPYKESLYKRYGKSPVDELWNKAMSLARHFIGGRKNVLKEKYSAIASYLVAEKIQEGKFGEASFYSRFEKATGTETEKFRSALFEEYQNRTEVFRDMYANEKVTYMYKNENNELVEETKTLSEWNELFRETKISKEAMNEIIEEVKKIPSIQAKANYNGTAQNDTTSQYFSKNK